MYCKTKFFAQNRTVDVNLDLINIYVVDYKQSIYTNINFVN